MPKYQGDPRWITAKFDSACACGMLIKRGEQVFYYPNGRKALCAKCGAKASAEFQAAADDEAMMSGQSY